MFVYYFIGVLQSDTPDGVSKEACGLEGESAEVMEVSEVIPFRSVGTAPYGRTFLLLTWR